MDLATFSTLASFSDSTQITFGFSNYIYKLLYIKATMLHFLIFSVYKNNKYNRPLMAYYAKL